MAKKLTKSILNFAGKVWKWTSSEHGSRTVVLVAIILFISYFTFDAFVRHDNFHSLREDLGNMDQTVWNVLHGNGFTLTDPTGTAQESRLAIHADFLLILLAPFYLIWSDPKMLLLIQAVVLACGAIPLFWLTKKVLNNRVIALLFALAYLLYPTVQMNTLHDFHATSLSTTLFLFAFWYFSESKPVWFTLFAILAALGKEQFWLVTALMGVPWIMKSRYRLFGIAVTFVSLIIFYLIFLKFMPAASQASQHWALSYLSDYGGSFSEIMRNIVVHPLKTLSNIFAADRLYYYFQLLIPVSFLSLLSPLTLILTVPDLAINVLSNDPLMRMIDYQYTSGITPWIFVSAIYGFKVTENLLRENLKLKRFSAAILGTIVAICVIISVYVCGELPFGPRTRFWYFQWAPPEASTIRQVAKIIPTKYSVSVTNNIGAHFSGRQFLYNYPANATSSAYVVVELGDQYAWPNGDEQQHVLQSLLSGSKFEVIAQTGQFYALKQLGL